MSIVAVQEEQGIMVDGNSAAKCDSCNTPECEFNRGQPVICSRYGTEVKSETRVQDGKTQVCFHCKVNGLTSSWFNLQDDEESAKYEDTVACKAAVELHCRGKDIVVSQINIDYAKGIGDAEIQELIALSKNSDVEQFLLDEVHKTVSYHDDHVIKADFYTGISAYLDPLNFALKCESGSGKTYSTVQTLTFLPPEDVQMIGSQSPKVISHENGVLKDLDGNIIEDPPTKPRRADFDTQECYNSAVDEYYIEKKAYDLRLKDSYYEVTLSNKVFVFLESINVETFMMIKSTLSHDNETIDHKWVDDNNKVHITRLVGYPSCIFNSLDNEYMSEFATRTLTAAPKTTQPKIKASMVISNNKAAYPFLYKQESRNKRLIQVYIRQIRKLAKDLKLSSLTPFPTLHDKFRSLETRDMRDFNHFLQLVPAFALFHLFQRPIITVNGDNYLLATVQDVLDAKALFDSVSLTTKTSTESRILIFYYDTVKPQLSGATLNTLTDIYNRDHKKVSSRTIQRWLDRLSDIEWIDAREGLQTEKHTLTYIPLQAIKEDTNQSQLNDTVIKLNDKNDLSIDLASFCQKDFDLWQKKVLTTASPTRQIILNFDGTETPITEDQFKEIMVHVNSPCRQDNLTPESTLKTENIPESLDNRKMSLSSMTTSCSPVSEISSLSQLAPSEIVKDVDCPVCGFHSQLLQYEATMKDGSVKKACSRCGDEFYMNIYGKESTP
jgi:hypothetical protein